MPPRSHLPSPLSAMLLFVLLCPVPALAEGPAPARGVVTVVEIEGLQRVEPAALRARLAITPGEELTPEIVRGALRALWASGLVQDVVAEIEPADEDGGVILKFMVTESPSVRSVVLQGNKKIDEDDLREVMVLGVGAVLRSADLTHDAAALRDLYVEKGYFLAEVEPVVRDLADNQVEVEFAIVEHRKVLVTQVSVSGNEHLPAARIRRYLQTKEAGVVPWLTNRGSFQPDHLDEDVYTVRSLYMEEGYVDVEVAPPRVFLSPDKRGVLVFLHVEEGPRYRLGEVAVAGDELPDLGLTRATVQRLIDGEDLWDVQRSIARELPGVEPPLRSPAARQGASGPSALRSGEWFQLSALQEVMQRIKDLYADQGYAFAQVIPLTETDAVRQVVDVTLDVQAGEPYTIARIDISGNDPTFDKVVRREIPLMEGARYSSSALAEARARLQRLGFFEEVRIATPQGDEEGTLDMEVEVVEQPTGSFSAQAGFSSLDNFTLGFSMAKNNFLGLGVGMNVSVNVSANQQQGSVSYSDPHFLDSGWTFAAGAYSRYTSYNESEYRHGGSLSLGRYLDPREDLSLSLQYKYENAGVTSVDAYKKRLLGGQLFRSGVTSSLGLTLSLDKRDNRIRPTRGLYANLSSEVSGGFRVNDEQVLNLLGGDFQLWESQANLRLFQPVIPGSDRLVLRFNSTLGYIVSTDGSVVPYIHRYRAGGINSVRGFDWYSLGPSLRVTGYSSDSSSDSSTAYGSDDPAAADEKLVVGGTKLWVNNLEVEMNVVPQAGISAVAFIDAGNAFGDPWNQGRIDPLALRASYGFGVRWTSPMGPLRFEWGLPFQPQEGERRIVFDFSMGSFF